MKRRDLVVGALIAALYVAMSLLLAPISYGPIQFRLAEALTILPLIFPSAVPGLFVGCLITNIFGGYGALDIICGSLATLLAAYLTYRIGRAVKSDRSAVLLGGLPPVIVNAVVVGLMLQFTYLHTADAMPFYIFGAQIFVSQFGVIYAIGIPFYYFVKRLNLNKITQS